MLLVLSIIVSYPCIALAVSQLTHNTDLSQFDNFDYSNLHPLTKINATGASYVTRLSSGTVFFNPYNATLNILWS